MLWPVLLLLSLCTSACLVDPDDRCGAHQKMDGERCLCESGYVLVEDECVKKTKALGKACKVDDDCSDPDYDYCAHEGDAGYCTKRDCAEDPSVCDLTVDYACNDRGKISFCERPRDGIGEACDESADCADFTATYCESIDQHVCLVNECKSDPSVCHGDWVCCDISLLKNSICIPPSALEEGKCPVGGELIPRSE